MQNRQLIFSPRKPYDLVAERSEAAAPCLQFPVWWARMESNHRPRNYQLRVLPLNYVPYKDIVTKTAPIAIWAVFVAVSDAYGTRSYTFAPVPSNRVPGGPKVASALQTGSLSVESQFLSAFNTGLLLSSRVAPR